MTLKWFDIVEELFSHKMMIGYYYELYSFKSLYIQHEIFGGGLEKGLTILLLNETHAHVYKYLCVNILL